MTARIRARLGEQPAYEASEAVEQSVEVKPESVQEREETPARSTDEESDDTPGRQAISVPPKPPAIGHAKQVAFRRKPRQMSLFRGNPATCSLRLKDDVPGTTSLGRIPKGGNALRRHLQTATGRIGLPDRGGEQM